MYMVYRCLVYTRRYIQCTSNRKALERKYSTVHTVYVKQERGSTQLNYSTCICNLPYQMLIDQLHRQVVIGSINQKSPETESRLVNDFHLIDRKLQQRVINRYICQYCAYSN